MSSAEAAATVSKTTILGSFVYVIEMSNNESSPNSPEVETDQKFNDLKALAVPEVPSCESSEEGSVFNWAEYESLHREQEEDVMQTSMKELLEEKEQEETRVPNVRMEKMRALMDKYGEEGNTWRRVEEPVRGN